MSTEPIRLHHFLPDTRDKRIYDLNQMLSWIHVVGDKFPLPFVHIGLSQITYLYFWPNNQVTINSLRVVQGFKMFLNV